MSRAEQVEACWDALAAERAAAALDAAIDTAMARLGMLVTS